MIEHLFVTKKYGNYADTLLLLGLVQLVEYALRQTNQKSDVELFDEGTRYRIQLKQAVNLEEIAKLNYTNPFPPVKGQKTDTSKIPQETDFFDTVRESEKRKLYKDYVFQQRGKPQWNEEAPKPPHASTQNGVILTSMRHDRNHNELWLGGYQLKDNYGALLVALFQAFSEETNSELNTEPNRCQELFAQATTCKLPEVASAVKIYQPTSVQGVNRVKADSNKVDSQKADWLSLWLIAGGLFSFGVTERIKIADRVFDWRVVVLEPQDIQLSKYREVLDRLRKYNPPSGGHGIARFDAELVLRFCQELLNNHASQADTQVDEFDIWEPINHFVKSFVGTHFGSKGQVYGVKEVFSLGLPAWIRPENSQELTHYQSVLQEHLWVISTLSAEDGHSELLTAYRDFITGTSLRQFFPFQISYADYVIKRLADPKARPPRLFSVTGLNTMTKKDTDFIKITQDPSFLRIAKAINQATVYAGKVQTKGGLKELEWQRTYGLAQRLSSQSGSKNDFLKEITDFLAKYEAENLRLSEQLQGKGESLKRVWTTKEDLDRLVELVTENDTVLVANLLIAYGYARWTKPKNDDLETDPEQDINDLDDTAISGESNDD
ncbi:hypothetical protein H6G76_31525 [Nostoc sp. FACHB-152]|uniref:hypothetical protein n=1 Tax=Nostoc sp. FACHB-152 TaxID=2692837 RepID=UPI001688179F|nr:hypothetical protein [Nostoc sp. FACHB-152]MBD2451569.1 hypothetical protein [Nostoc sp. FACHB-152]